MPNLIVTEKPSVAQAIGKALGITKRQTGYLESDEYLISWCVGHLVELAALYDLTSLQRDADRLLGYSAQQTLDYTQALYEKKLVTYPCTDSRYLTEDMEPHRYAETTVQMECAGTVFTAKGKTALAEGWKAVERAALGDTSQKNEENWIFCPRCRSRNPLPILNAQLKEGKMSPPKLEADDRGHRKRTNSFGKYQVYGENILPYPVFHKLPDDTLYTGHILHHSCVQLFPA